MREVIYTADIGSEMFKDSELYLVPARVGTTEVYNSNCDVLKLEGKSYFIGEGDYEINIKKHEKSSYLPLLLSGIARAYDDEYIKVKLGLGLPLNQFKTCGHELTTMLEDTRYSVVFNGKPKIIEITSVNVYPEGISAFQYMIDDYEDIIGTRDVIVVDIGGYTTDICLINDYKATKLTSLTVGTIHMHDAIKKAIEDKYIDVKISIDKVRHYINQGFWYEGEEQDLSFAMSSIEPFFNKIYNELKLNYPITTEILFLTGGGAELLSDLFTDFISDVIVVDDLFSNAKGYYTLLKEE